MKTIVFALDIPMLASFIVATILYNKLGEALKAVALFIFCSVAIEVVSLVFCLFGKNNMALLHLYAPLSFVCLAVFYRKVLGNLIDRKIMWTVVALFCAFSIINSIYQGVNRFNSDVLVVESVLIIILSMFTFIFLLNETVKESVVRDVISLNWINAGVFIYYLSCLLIFYFGDKILFHFSKEQSQLTWVFHAVFSMVMYACFIIGLWKRPKTQYS